MLKYIALFLSTLLHPIVMPALTLVLAVNLDPLIHILVPEEAFRNLFYLVLITTFALPAISVFLLFKFGTISSLEMEDRKDRLIPFALCLLYLIATYLLLMQAPLPPSIFSLLLGGIIAVLLTTIITVFWKISIHMVGYMGMLGGITGLFALHPFPYLDLFIFILLIGGLLGTSRTILNAHRAREIIAGGAVGFLVEFLVVSQNWYF